MDASRNHSSGKLRRTATLAVAWLAARLRKHSFAAAATTLGIFVVGALFDGALFHDRTFFERDLSAYYYPAKWLVAPLARASGGIPLWNPFFASGQPFAANPEHELFHPLTTLFFLLPFEWAFRLQVILPPLAGALSMFWFLRHLGRSRTAALAGAMAWGFGGYLLSSTLLLPTLFSASVIPLTLTFVVRSLRTPTRSNIAGLALGLGLQCLAGEPSTLLVMPFLVLATGLSPRIRPGRREVWMLAVGLALGVTLGALVLLPGMHHAGKTIRGLGLTDSMANEWSMPAVRALELFSPHILGHVNRADVTQYWGRSLYGEKTFAFIYSLYPGLLISLLALAAWRARWRALLGWGVVALLGYAVALGDHFVAWPLLRHLPGLSAMRYPERFVQLFIFPITVVGSYGFDWIVMGKAQMRRRCLRWFGGLALSGLALAGAVMLAAPLLAGVLPVRLAAGDALRLAVVALVSLAALKLRRRRHVGLALCAVLAIDLTSAGRALVPTVPVSRLASPPVFLAPLLKDDRDELVFHMAEWDPQRSASGGLAKPPIPARWGLAMTLERDFDFTQLRWTFDSTRTLMLAANSDPRLIEPLLWRRGVTAIVQFGAGTRWEGHRLVRPGGGPLVETLRARDTNPFAFAASRVEIVRGQAGWTSAMAKLRDEIPQTACIEDTELSVFPGQPAPAEVHIQRETPMHFRLEVDARGPGPSFVAINQTWDEGWRAQLNGKPTRVYRTELSLSGVVVPEGKHTIAFDYQDPWVSAGLGISLLSALACLALLVL
jgi:hypothetical protein